MLNPKTFKPEWFINSNGEQVKTEEELKIMFDNHRFPMPFDLWIPCATAALLAVLQKIWMINMESTLYSVCKEKENEQLRIEKSKKATECMFKGTYFTVTTIACTIIL